MAREKRPVYKVQMTKEISNIMRSISVFIGWFLFL